MRKALVLILIIGLVFVGIGQGMTYVVNDNPAKIASVMWERYQAFLNGETTFANFYYTLEKYAGDQIRDDLMANSTAYRQELLAIPQQLKQQDVKIKGYEFSKPQYNKAKDMVNVFRIQEFSNGQKLYFVQTFSKEDGTWKMVGDQMLPPFDMKQLQ